MLKEMARPIALVFCILSLYAVLQAAFFDLATDAPHRLREALGMLGLSAAVCLLSGWIFRDGEHSSGRRGRLVATLPVQLFCWASGVMAVLFALAWYLETVSVFEGHVRY
jgi:hypothetical protein